MTTTSFPHFNPAAHLYTVHPSLNLFLGQFAARRSHPARPTLPQDLPHFSSHKVQFLVFSAWTSTTNCNDLPCGNSKTAGKKGTARKEVFALSRDARTASADCGRHGYGGFCLVSTPFLLGSSLPFSLHRPPVPRKSSPNCSRPVRPCGTARAKLASKATMFSYQKLNHPAYTLPTPLFFISQVSTLNERHECGEKSKL